MVTLGTSNSLWTEKYRPKSIDDYVFKDDEQRSQVEQWIRTKNIPNLLLAGAPGTGKSSLAKLLIYHCEIDDLDVMIANGSKEGRKIEWLTDKLVGFCETIPWGRYKVVLLDEADYLGATSVQPAMRNLMEEYSDYVRFIMTANYPNKIIPALHSRCQGFFIEKIDHVEFTARVANILINEDIEFDLDQLDTYVKATYPDLRKCINLVQQYSIDGKLGSPTSKNNQSTADYRVEAVSLIQAGKIYKAREVICGNFSTDDVESVYRWMYDNLSLWGDTQEQKDQAILAIAKGLRNIPIVADQEINLSACLVELSMIRET